MPTTFSLTTRRGRAAELRRSLRLDLANRDGLRGEKNKDLEEAKGDLEVGRGENEVRSWNWAVDEVAISRI